LLDSVEGQTLVHSSLDDGIQTSDVWLKCQAEEVLLITANRNDDGPDSLEATIRRHGTPQSLSVCNSFLGPDRFVKSPRAIRRPSLFLPLAAETLALALIGWRGGGTALA